MLRQAARPARGIALLARHASTQPSTRYTAVTHPEDAADVPAEVADFIHQKSKYLLPVYARPPLVMSHGKGMHIYDTQERKYLDFTAGIAVNALGHSDEELAKIMSEQASTLLHSSNVYHNQWAGILAEQLVTLTQKYGGLGWTPGSNDQSGSHSARVFFANSGTEANEGALKVARKVGKERWAKKRFGRLWDMKNPEDALCEKTGIVCFDQGFHGRSMGALSVTSNPKYQKPFGPLIPDVAVGKLNDVSALESLVHDGTCAVIVEPIQGEGGVNAANEEFLRALRKRCNEVGAVLIFDEIQCGLFRTGSMWAHGTLPTDCHPDVITMAKPLANGFPIGAVVIRENVAEVMTAGSHGTTFGGSPLACRLGSHVLGRLAETPFVKQMNESATYLQSRLARLSDFFPTIVGPTRGRGLILGIPFIKDPDGHPAQLVSLARQRGLLLLTAGKDAVRIVPSLNVQKTDIDEAVDVIESCLGLIAKGDF
ncbi:acetylornithine and succinylornithine aminotransferase [Sistotremastrum niveocremeum HHB9708]|uniref:acetylornithine transaminase n=2 Tax=Sistotremastraceae TaxID=3402574 RepID=A0A164Z4Z3_9AGAM|nr:acetylornithine and succinylornithine aminotransferase [Sistotremastrum niveocremeum HHB9708]KZT37655.1 acetylornithine and succinylornithine aminotransferase [Sistotremastrum suecicum HHB10207 ss-3]